jgi:hypothetical protein
MGETENGIEQENPLIENEIQTQVRDAMEKMKQTKELVLAGSITEGILARLRQQGIPLKDHFAELHMVTRVANAIGTYPLINPDAEAALNATAVTIATDRMRTAKETGTYIDDFEIVEEVREQVGSMYPKVPIPIPRVRHVVRPLLPYQQITTGNLMRQTPLNTPPQRDAFANSIKKGT